MHSFTTERLLLRPLEAQDKQLYLSLYTDAKTMRHIGEPLSTQAAEKAFNNTVKAMQSDSPKVMTWAMVTLENNNCIGLQALNWLAPNTADIGIMILRTSSGKLLPEEAIGSLIEYGFNHLALKQINSRFAKKNLATARVSKKAGFVFDSTKQPLDTLQKVNFSINNC